MPQVNEFTPLLVESRQQNPPLFQRRALQYVLVCVLSFGVLCFLLQRSAIVDVDNVTVSFNETSPSTSDNADEVAFWSSIDAFKDPTVDPCVDFYQYACSGWLKTHDIPVDRPIIDSSFDVISERNKETLQNIFDQNPPQIGPLYHSCLSGPEVDTDAVHYVASFIDKIHLANSTLELMTIAGEVDQSLGISTFFSLSVSADPKDPDTNVLQLSQGGLTLPSREYYLEPDKVGAYARLFVDYVTKVFAINDLNEHNASEFANSVLETETIFAKISLPAAALRNPLTTSTAYPFPDIATRYPFLMAYLNGIYKLEPFPMIHAIIATPSFFDAQNKVLQDESRLSQLKYYVSFHLIDSLGALLGEYFRRASHDFHGAIQGAKTLLPRNQFCERLTTNYLGDEVGKYYMQQVFGPDTKAAAQALLTEIEESLKALLLTESWLDKITYEAAVDKLKNVKNYIGGPDSVEPLPFQLKPDAFFDNMKKILQQSAAETIQSINKPVDKQAWDMFPSTVNAYYDPSANKMVFPAAILQPPFYSAEHFPAAANFARIGMVMGHELSHGFDDQGRNFDANGTLRSWWTPSVSNEFAAKAQCLVAQYSSFPVVSSQDGRVLGNVNGNLTLGENIADNGGIRLAFEAYHLWKSTVAAPPVVPPSTTPIPSEEPARTDPVKPSPQALPPVPEIKMPQPTPSKVNPVPVTSQPAELKPSNGEPEKKTTKENSPTPVPKQQPATPEINPAAAVPAVTSSPKNPSVPPVPSDKPDSSQPPIPTPLPQAGQDRMPATTETNPPSLIPPTTSPTTKSPDTPRPVSSPVIVPSIPPANIPSPNSVPEEIPASSKPGTPAGVPIVPPLSTDTPSSPPVVPHLPDTPPGGPNASQQPVPAPPLVPDIPPPPVQKSPSAVAPPPQPIPETKPSTEIPSVLPPPTAPSSPPPIVSKTPTPSSVSEPPVPTSAPPVPTSAPPTPPPKARSEDTPSHKITKNKHSNERGDGSKKDEHNLKSDKHHDNSASKEDNATKHKREHGEKKNERDEVSHKGKHGEYEQNERDDHREEEDEDRKHDEKHRHDKHVEEEHESKKHEHKSKKHKHEEHESKKHKYGHEERKSKEHEHKVHKRKKHEHKHDQILDLTVVKDKYPFSKGDARIHTMVEYMARALVQSESPVADSQLFFTAFAQNWCEKSTPEYAELLRTIDPHSPGKWRVNGPLMNYNKFAETFSCPVGTPMNPDKKCIVW
ncbi:putative peptidase M13, metallopeptidase, catalytic domain superfamily [Plasmopara halstedii]